MKHFGLYINGSFVQSSNHFDMNEPWQAAATQTRLAIIKRHSPTDQELLNAALEGAFLTFGQIQKGFFPLSERLHFIKKLKVKLDDQRHNIARLICQETGKPLSLALAEIGRAGETIAETLRVAPEFLSEQQLNAPHPAKFANSAASFVREPRGVLVAITPFNFPVNLLIHKIIPAIASGCPVIVKPSPKSQLSTLTLIDFMHACELPAGMLSMIQIENEQVPDLVGDPRVAHFSFTGSAAVGWTLARASLKPYTLELGGNASVFLDENADPELAVQKLIPGAFNHSGQVCISVQHIFAHQKIAAEVSKLLVETTRKFPYGNPFDPRTLAGPLIDDGANTRLKKLRDHLIKVGAKTLSSSENKILSDASFFIPPDAAIKFDETDTLPPISERLLMSPEILVNVPRENPIYQNEVFGPLVTFDECRDFEEYLHWANARMHRLQAAVFTSNPEIASRAGRELDYGGVMFNEPPSLRFDALPYGGRGLAGRGREGPQFALGEFTDLKTVIKSGI